MRRPRATHHVIVVGGTYGERCRFPAWDQLFGSGLRAAIALSGVSPGTTLHTFAPGIWYDDIAATLASLGLGSALHRVEQAISFEYLHPFELIGEPAPINGPRPTLNVAGDVILRFGMVEGDARVAGRRVVYDPQSTPLAVFAENGSTAKELALIVTPRELLKLSGREDSDASDDQARRDAAVEMFDLWPSGALILLVKDALGGLAVFTGDDDPHRVPSYSAESYFRIGSGDVMAAAFAHAWGERNLSVIEAADYAARSLAYFVEGPRLPIPEPEALRDRKPMRQRPGTVRILGAGALDLETLVLATDDWINELGGRAVYDLWDAGAQVGGSESALVLIGSSFTDADLHAVSAAAAGLPSVVYWPGGSSALAQHFFPGSRVTDDYATALYHALRSTDE
jgi:hypothetical protein